MQVPVAPRAAVAAAMGVPVCFFYDCMGCVGAGRPMKTELNWITQCLRDQLAKILRNNCEAPMQEPMAELFEASIAFMEKLAERYPSDPDLEHNED